MNLPKNENSQEFKTRFYTKFTSKLYIRSELHKQSNLEILYGSQQASILVQYL
ncbi:hypothetical protein PEDI_53520 [Persicobacter diffluens]|uniref:Uncharacterized protein n=1 Tax=Persicobacter diffluens TaxID=981 RepID=A0AAN4W582_9BACT|nr:hypothetical protein PEDI_53520 [Persicobacter diffluens]